MDFEKIRQMMMSEEKEMKTLAENICRQASLKNIDDVSKLILLWHSSDKSLLLRTRPVIHRIPRSVKTYKRIVSHLPTFSSGGRLLACSLLNKIMSTRSLKHHFYTIEEWHMREERKAFWLRKDYTYLDAIKEK